MTSQQSLDEPGDVPIKLAALEWQFAPCIQKSDEESLKHVFVRAALEWIEKTIREAVGALQADPSLKSAFRVINGGSTTNHKTGQTIEILYCAIVRIKPHLTEVMLYLGTPEEVKQAFRICKRTHQEESAKAHKPDN